MSLKKNKVKVVLVIHSLQEGGMERVMSILADEFSKFSYIELHIILYGIKPEIFYSLPKKINIHKPSFEFNSSRRFLSTIKRMIFLRKKFKEIEPTSILSFGERWNNFVLIAGLKLNLSFYISERAQPNLSLGFFHDSLRKWLYPKAKKIILQTKYAKSYYEKKYDNISVIENPIKTIESKNNIKRENNILMVGRFVESKNHDKLITIFSKINKPNWNLVLLGDNAQGQKNKQRLEKLASDLNIKNRVIFLGKQKYVDDYYLKSKIFAFTSSSEGFPNVIGEAMSAGLPIVSYDCIAGPSEIIKDNEDGFLIPLFDDIFFQKKLEELMGNEELRVRMGNKARENIKRFSTKQIACKFLETILSKEEIAIID